MCSVQEHYNTHLLFGTQHSLQKTNSASTHKKVIRKRTLRWLPPANQFRIHNLVCDKERQYLVEKYWSHNSPHWYLFPVCRSCPLPAPAIGVQTDNEDCPTLR